MTRDNQAGLTKVSDRYAEETRLDALDLFWTKRSRWLFTCGVMPWNWFNSDIWTAFVMSERERSVVKAGRQALQVSK